MRPDLLVEVEAVAGTGKTTLFRRLLEARGVLVLGDVQRSLAFRLARSLTSRSH